MLLQAQAIGPSPLPWTLVRVLVFIYQFSNFFFFFSSSKSAAMASLDVGTPRSFDVLEQSDQVLDPSPTPNFVIVYKFVACVF